MNSKFGNVTRRRPEFGSGKAGDEAAKLKKFSDAGGPRRQWLPDAAQGSPNNVSLFGARRSQKPSFEVIWV